VFETGTLDPILSFPMFSLLWLVFLDVPRLEDLGLTVVGIADSGVNTALDLKNTAANEVANFVSDVRGLGSLLALVGYHIEGELDLASKGDILEVLDSNVSRRLKVPHLEDLGHTGVGIADSGVNTALDLKNTVANEFANSARDDLLLCSLQGWSDHADRD